MRGRKGISSRGRNHRDDIFKPAEGKLRWLRRWVRLGEISSSHERLELMATYITREWIPISWQFCPSMLGSWRLKIHSRTFLLKKIRKDGQILEILSIFSCSQGRGTSCSCCGNRGLEGRWALRYDGTGLAMFRPLRKR